MLKPTQTISFILGTASVAIIALLFFGIIPIKSFAIFALGMGTGVLLIVALLAATFKIY